MEHKLWIKIEFFREPEAAGIFGSVRGKLLDEFDKLEIKPSDHV